MSKKVHLRFSSDSLFSRMFIKCVHRNAKNEYYYDGTCVDYNPGVMVDFKNIEHTYEIFQLFGPYWGGCNACPTSDEMYVVARRWEDEFGAEIVGLDYDSIDFRVNRELSDAEVVSLISEIKVINAEPNCAGGFTGFGSCIKEKGEFYVWWN